MKEIDPELVEVKGYSEIINTPASKSTFLRRKTSIDLRKKSIQSYDKNELNKGDKVSHVFKFKNTGDAPLIVSDVKSVNKPSV